MSIYKAALFDADGVVVQAPDYFSRMYAKKHGIELQELEAFFDDKFRATSIGKADLKELIEERRDLWRLNGTPDDLLREWLELENYPYKPLLDLIAVKRAEGLAVALASVQEKYRAAYMRDIMFPDVFDRMFFSCELGHFKSDPKFYEMIVEALGLRPAEIAYFDDSQLAVNIAASVGIASYLYQNTDQVRAVLA